MDDSGHLERLVRRVINKMRSKKRKIIMLCDNCAAHAGDIQLTNVKLAFLPPNMTSLIQPMDQGIIANFKKQYRSVVLCRLVNNIDAGRRQVLELQKWLGS